MFKRGDLYYYMTGSDCCYCQWGGDAKVWTAYDPLGPWHPSIAPEPSSSICDLSGSWICHNGSDVNCSHSGYNIVQDSDNGTFIFGPGTGSVLKNGYVFATNAPNSFPGVVTSADGKSSGCDRIRWYGDEKSHWCRKGLQCEEPSSYKDPLEVNYCANGSFPIEGWRDNPCAPHDPEKGQNFTIPAQQFNVVQFYNGQEKVILYYGERANSGPDRLMAHNFQAWVPMMFDDESGKILPLGFPNNFTIEIDA